MPSMQLNPVIQTKSSDRGVKTFLGVSSNSVMLKANLMASATQGMQHQDCKSRIFPKTLLTNENQPPWLGHPLLAALTGTAKFPFAEPASTATGEKTCCNET